MTKDVGLMVVPKGVGKLARQLFNTEHGLYAEINPIIESASIGSETTAGQDILQKRLERGDIVECGIVFTKRGICK